MAGGPLVVDVADLLHRPGNSRREHLEADLDGLNAAGGRVPDGALVTLDLRLEALNAGIVVTGVIATEWEGECRRCLRPIRSRMQVPVQEIFEADPVEGETSKLDVNRIDLEPLAREVVLLELPLAPLCRDDCPGLCPVCGADKAESESSGGCGHDEQAVDIRWAGLGDLRFDG
jgi:uncharacterized protein